MPRALFASDAWMWMISRGHASIPPTAGGLLADSRMMPILRLLLLVALLGAASWLAWHVPWKADARHNEVDLTAQLPDAPYFQPPTPPNPKVFGNRISPFIAPGSIDIAVSIDRIALFQRFAAMVIGGFFVYGVIGYFFTNRPRPADVLYSLGITTGFIAGTVASAIAAQLSPGHGPLPWLNIFWAVGVAIALVIITLGRTRPFPGT